MEEDVSTLQSVVGVEQQIGGPHKKLPLEENKDPSRIPNKEQGMEQATRKRKGFEEHNIAVGVKAKDEACRNLPTPEK